MKKWELQQEKIINKITGVNKPDAGAKQTTSKDSLPS
jgi:hypothetical protein